MAQFSSKITSVITPQVWTHSNSILKVITNNSLLNNSQHPIIQNIRQFNKNYNENLPWHRHQRDWPKELKKRYLPRQDPWYCLDRCIFKDKCSERNKPERMDEWIFKRQGPKKYKPLPPVFPLPPYERSRVGTAFPPDTFADDD